MLPLPEAKAVIAANILPTPGIVGVGLHPDPAINVYVRDQQSAAMVPPTLAGYPTKTRIVGNLVAFNNNELLTRPVIGGVSISVDTINATGTLGSVVYAVGTGNPLFLSCWHVLSYGTPVGTTVYQPGDADGGSPTNTTDVIGSSSLLSALSSSGTYDIDAALGTPNPVSVLGPVSFVGLPTTPTTTAVATPVIGTQLIKSGRTTGITTGKISDVSATMKVGGYPWGFTTFDNVIVTEASMAMPGDSGSVALDGNGNAVGLLFGGSPAVTLFNSMVAVCSTLGITFTPDGSPVKVLSSPPATVSTPIPGPHQYYTVPLATGIASLAVAGYLFSRH
jgi:hypothetical protein